MSSFPDVLSATLTYQTGEQSNNTTFTVPSTYAFAVVQVCLIPGDTAGTLMVVRTSHGAFSFDDYNNNSPDSILKDSPILNLIIKGGESFSLINHQRLGYGNLVDTIKAKVTALCHKKPS